VDRLLASEPASGCPLENSVLQMAFYTGLSSGGGEYLQHYFVGSPKSGIIILLTEI
jgi:hypothetical protein